MRKIKLLYVDDVFDFGGGEQHLMLLIKGLDKNKYEISVACRKKSYLSEQMEALNCKVECIKFRNKFDLIGMLSFYFLLVKRKYDIVHLQDNRSHWLGAFACKLAGVPIKIATVHMVNISRRLQPAKFVKIILAMADLLWASMVDVITTIAYFNKNILIAEGIKEEKIKVIYNGINLNLSGPKPISKKDLGIDDSSLLIGTVARLSIQKGITYLIKAVSQLLKDYPTIFLLIVGDGPEKEKLINYAHKCGLDKNVKFLGFKPDPLNYLKLFDIFVLSSLYEGLPIAIIEAMAASKAVVATKVGAADELVVEGKTGLLVSPQDVDGLKKAIGELIENASLRILMGQEGKRQAEEKFHINKMVSETHSLYQKLLREAKELSQEDLQ